MKSLIPLSATLLALVLRKHASAAEVARASGENGRERPRSLECQPAAPSRLKGGNVCFGLKADIGACSRDVRFTLKSGHWLSVSGCPLCAKSGHSALQ
jgi:hypothetical protein